MIVNGITPAATGQALGAANLQNLTGAMAPVGAPQVAGAPSFGEMVSQGIESVNQELVASQTDLQGLATGNVQNLHQVMIRLEESRLSFQLFMQVRNRLLEAYQDIMKMQV
ncbi:MAG TPA: flagellar hook-basal body complex protein FliE [Geothrix sp.]|nr:flagellar hook-basal body complex protein FliE [Geothrix sp.]